MVNTDIDFATATANMTAAETEAYFKSLPTEKKEEQAPVAKVETPEPKKAEEVVIPKDKSAQKIKIL
jgi:hypothetical protein